MSRRGEGGAAGVWSAEQTGAFFTAFHKHGQDFEQVQLCCGCLRAQLLVGASARRRCGTAPYTLLRAVCTTPPPPSADVITLPHGCLRSRRCRPTAGGQRASVRRSTAASTPTCPSPQPCSRPRPFQPLWMLRRRRSHRARPAAAAAAEPRRLPAAPQPLTSSKRRARRAARRARRALGWLPGARVARPSAEWCVPCLWGAWAWVAACVSPVLAALLSGLPTLLLTPHHSVAPSSPRAGARPCLAPSAGEATTRMSITRRRQTAAPAPASRRASGGARRRAEGSTSRAAAGPMRVRALA